MNADEREICAYLKGWPGQFVAFKEICRRAGGKRRFEKEPYWALPALTHLVELGILESDSTGHYRLKKKLKKREPKRWLSPQVRKALEKSGKDFQGVIELEDDPDAESLLPPTQS